MQKYFSYKMTIICGLPSVTLLGEASDWQDILARLDKLDQLGDEPTQFAEMLRPILRRMVLCFSQPSSTDVTDFWNTMITRIHQGSGMHYISGWLSVFCFWKEAGAARRRSHDNVVLDGLSYPYADIQEVPAGFASVPVNVNDHGEVYDSTLIAGSVGILARPSAPGVASEGGSGEASGESRSYSEGPSALRAIQPYSGWWMCENEPAEAAESREREMEVLQEQSPSCKITSFSFLYAGA
ncbi:hypothetical protein HRG_002181 [Hirsutella rhossiliensis]